MVYVPNCYKMLPFKHIINPIHPNISMHILHTSLSAFLKVLVRRICLTIENSLVCDRFVYSHDLKVWFRSNIVRRNKILVTLRGHKIKKDNILFNVLL